MAVEGQAERKPQLRHPFQCHFSFLFQVIQVFLTLENKVMTVASLSVILNCLLFLKILHSCEVISVPLIDANGMGKRYLEEVKSSSNEVQFGFL